MHVKIATILLIPPATFGLCEVACASASGIFQLHRDVTEAQHRTTDFAM
jgi:hypothetical protein